MTSTVHFLFCQICSQTPSALTASFFPFSSSFAFQSSIQPIRRLLNSTTTFHPLLIIFVNLLLHILSKFVSILMFTCQSWVLTKKVQICLQKYRKNQYSEEVGRRSYIRKIREISTKMIWRYITGINNNKPVRNY